MLAHITPRGISALLGPVVKLHCNFTLLTPDMLAHITPRGISVLPGPVVKLLGNFTLYTIRAAMSERIA
jgi:hypothetical protein